MSKDEQKDEPKSDANDGDLVATLMLAFIALVLGCMSSCAYMKSEAVDHGAAHYDTKTAHFTWNDEGTK